MMYVVSQGGNTPSFKVCKSERFHFIFRFGCISSTFTFSHQLNTSWKRS